MADKSKKQLATVILISRQLRLDLIDVQALDTSLSDNAFRIHCVISTHFGNKSGLTFVSIEYLAAATGKSVATVQRAILELEKAGYLIVKRRCLGTRTFRGKVYQNYGAKGAANEYLPAIDAAQITTMNSSGKNLGDRVVAAWQERVQRLLSKHIKNEVLTEPKDITGEVLPETQSTSFGQPKDLTSDVPTLSSPSEKNSTRARGPSRPDGLGPFGAIISKRVGDANYRSWFATASIVSETLDSVTLSVESKYKRDHIMAQFVPEILDCCRAAKPTVLRVDVVVREAA
jgi:hypothetical protein